MSIASTDTIDIRDQRPRVFIRIGEPYMRVAALALLENGNVRVESHDDGTPSLITDDPRQQSARTILIVEHTVGAAQAAVSAMRRRRLGAIVSRRDPEKLILAVTCLEEGVLTVPMSVLDLAESAPLLDSRQLRVLSLVGTGLGNARIAERLTLSEPTVKKVISDLLRIFDCNTRVELAMKATLVGYSAC